MSLRFSKARLFFIVGILCLCVGFLLELPFLLRITGNALLESVSLPYHSLIGLFFLIGGTLLLVEALEQRVRVSAHLQGKKESPDRDYHLSDPELFFGSRGGITLGEFKKEIQGLEKDKELLGIVRETYGSELLKIRASDEGSHASVADSFLRVLYGSMYVPVERKTLGHESVSKEEGDEIRNAFRPGWSGRPTPQQYRVLRKYGFEFEAKPGHGCIYACENPHLKKTVSSSPSDIHAGDNVGKDVVHLLYELRLKKEKED